MDEMGNRESSQWMLLVELVGLYAFLFLIYVATSGILLGIAVYTCEKSIERGSSYNLEERAALSVFTFVLLAMFAIVFVGPIWMCISDRRSKKKTTTCQVFPEVEDGELGE